MLPFAGLTPKLLDNALLLPWPVAAYWHHRPQMPVSPSALPT